MDFLYIILIVIAVIVFLIYKKQKSAPLSKEQSMENIKAQIAYKEERLLDHIKTNHLKDYMTTESALFECGRTNFIRLSERFKHDDAKLTQVIKDWTDYMEILDDAVYESELLDVSTEEGEGEEHWKRRDELYIQIQEIEKRFKDLLGKEYTDPEELMKLKRKSPNK